MQFLADQIPLPKPKCLPESSLKAPYAIIGDEAFPSMVNLLKPDPKCSKQGIKKARAIFNYCLSHARMCVECTFGILSSHFQFLQQRMMLSPGMATLCVQAAAVLHNYLIKDADPFVQEMEAKVEAALKEARDLNVSGLQSTQNARVSFQDGGKGCEKHLCFILFIKRRPCPMARPLHSY